MKNIQGLLAEYAAWVMAFGVAAPFFRAINMNAEGASMAAPAAVLASPMRWHESFIREAAQVGFVGETRPEFVSGVYSNPSAVEYYLVPAMFSLAWMAVPVAIALLPVARDFVPMRWSWRGRGDCLGSGRSRDRYRPRLTPLALAMAVLAILAPIIFEAWQSSRGMMLLLSFIAARSAESAPSLGTFAVVLFIRIGLIVLFLLGPPTLCLILRRWASIWWRRMRA